MEIRLRKTQAEDPCRGYPDRQIAKGVGTTASARAWLRRLWAFATTTGCVMFCYFDWISFGRGKIIHLGLWIWVPCIF